MTQVRRGYLGAWGSLRPRAASTTPASSCRDRIGLGLVACFHHDAHHRLGAARPQQHPSLVPKLRLGLHHRLPDLDAVGQALGLGDGHVHQALGHPFDQAVRQLGQRTAGPQHQVGQCDAGQDAVAGRRQGAEDDVTRLLATEAQAVGVQRGKDVAVAHVRLEHGDAALLHGEAEAEVGHDGHRHRGGGQAPALGQVEGEQREQHVTVDDGAGVVHRDDPVGIAVEREAQVGLALDDGPRQLTRVGRAAFLVDVDPVGRVVQRDDARTEVLEHLRRDVAGGAVGTVDHDAQAGQAAALRRRGQVLGVELHRLGVCRDPSHRVPGGTLRRAVRVGQDGVELALDLPLDVGGQLRPQAAEQFDAVVTEGVVRGRDDGTGHLAPLGHRGHTGGRQHAEVDDVGPLRGQAGREGGLEQRPRAPGVATDDEGGSGQDAGGGATEGQRQLGGELLVRNPAHAIGAEAGLRHSSRATAWSTAAPCGPS